MANNKVIFGDTTIMDITDTTAKASDVAAGKVFYDNSGVRTLGTGAGGSSDVVVITYGVTTYAEALAAIQSDKELVLKKPNETGSYIYYPFKTRWESSMETVYIHFVKTADATSATQMSLARWLVNSAGAWNEMIIPAYTKSGVDSLLAAKQDVLSTATDDTAGIIKTNSAESISVNANGQLTVGGRLGQFPDGGVYYPTTIEPTSVGSSSFLMTDGAKGASVAQRTFAILAGANITCKSAAAGSTTYRVSNTQTNRFALAAVVGGRAALSQADAAENGTAAITSIAFANGGSLTAPYFGANESNNDILVTLERSINPSSATTQIRVYGKNNATDNILVGQGVGANGGKVISLGQSCYAGGNQNVAIGNAAYVNANNSVGMGHTMLVNKQYCLSAGQGHDFTNGANGTTAVGTWSEIMNKTKFVVGNGTADNLRSNIFEVRDDNGTAVIMKSPNGTKYKLAVDDSGNLTTTAV